jgi:putative transposase
MRHTTFRFALEPTPTQEQVLARWAGASRFAYNQCLQLVTDALAAKRVNSRVRVPWSGFDLINAFNAWKRSEAAGRVFAVAPDGTVMQHATGLGWRHEIAAQVFEEAAMDLGRALAAYAETKAGRRKERTGFPRRKKRGRCRDSFRLRNKQGRRGSFSIQVGDGHPRSVTLPRIGQVRVHDDTRRLRRLLRPVQQTDPKTGESALAPRAKVLFATVARQGNRWYVSLNIQAPDLHPQRRHPTRCSQDHGGWVGLDRGLAAFAVAATADGMEVGRFQAPKPLARRLGQLRRCCRALSRTQLHSHNRAKVARRLSKEHARIADIRRSFLHEVSSQLVKTHDRLSLEHLTVANLVRNKHLARAIADAGWTELARQITYKQAWHGGQVRIADRWLPSTRTCSRCGLVGQRMGLGERVFRCDRCGLTVDRDRNAAANLAAWAERQHAQAPDRQAGGRSSTPLEGKALAVAVRDGGTGPDEGGTNASVRIGAEDTRGGWRRTASPRSFDVL